ncbi:16S rRNA (cytidine(1402)-2'-O)-methyltransferase [Nanchangia anserum]|uniref:Ribosomal RNA small subunit methyltransferase I n=1 Tax=Nanchangia anserum TaxID=2692125 RepID=A0A8I0G8L0_9ACTO|nr:16S rRNA (cytidine(1402)-2'-O)-methyltransferase [Nanchangia anserum]MBD3689144.1 16S rRNA (cytidine(1402)-2'-O)-methyltransferase [Nanchangia anserum]QOX81377.1 16S rRNA (cytidine(1402)-2'-O)-methyltransferase [Nanchangia anserum]
MSEHRTEPVLIPGTIALAATPIGNPLDASVRLRRALAEADVIAAEDTRRLERLAAALDVALHARIVASHDHNERDRAPWLIEEAQAGKRVLVVSDAGMPLISDPGFAVVQAAHEAGVALTILPGPSAPLAALALSGLSPARFSFEGFVPRKSGERGRVFAALAHEERTLIFFESPRRLADTLTAAVEAFGAERRGAVCRELTKTYEDIWRGSLADLAERARDGVLGEIVLVIAPAPAADADVSSLADEALRLAEGGMRLKDAARHVAVAGVSARDIFHEALAHKASRRE